MNEDPGMGGGPPQGGLPGGSGPGENRSAEPVEVDELRRRLQDAVSRIQPAPDALDRLREAVPARRRRRRATVLTTAATVVVLAIATPMVRTVVITDQSAAKSGEANAVTPSDSDSPGGDDSDGNGNQQEHGSLGASGTGPAGSSNGGSTAPSGTGAPGPTPAATLTAAPPPSFGPTNPLPSIPPATASATVGATTTPTPQAPACTISDLEQGVGTNLGAVGPDGMAYGTVEIRNISRRECGITGSGNVLVAAGPGNPPVQVSIKMHQAGDPATRLPEVPLAGNPLVVPAGAAYEFQFAWRPSPGPGVGGSCTPGDNPPGPPPPVPSLGYMLADGGVKLAEVPLTAACGGVVYRTDVYLTGAYPRTS